MLEALWAAWAVLPAAIYLVCLVAAWALVRDRYHRTMLLCALGMLPLAVVISTAYKFFNVHAAESSFERLCSELQPHSVSQAVTVESVLINTPYSKHIQSRHAQVAFAPRESAILLLNGATRYPWIEQATSWGGYQRRRRRENHPERLKASSSRISLDWTDVRHYDRYISEGVLAVTDRATDQRLAAFRTYVLDTPDVALLGEGYVGLRVALARSRSCPAPRELAALVKRVAMPARMD